MLLPFRHFIPRILEKTSNYPRFSAQKTSYVSSALATGNIPVPLAEHGRSDREEYFGTAQFNFKITAKRTRRSVDSSFVRRRRDSELSQASLAPRMFFVFQLFYFCLHSCGQFCLTHASPYKKNAHLRWTFFYTEKERFELSNPVKGYTISNYRINRRVSDAPIFIYFHVYPLS